MPAFRAALCLTIILLTTGAAALRAEPLPALGLEERQGWAAVGVVNEAGYRSKTSCTGTLIAPDLVLTAAHCAGDQKHFVAGWDRGSFVAHRRSVEAVVHPGYLTATGNDRFRYDVAVLRLETPIEPRAIAPIRLTDQPVLRIGLLTVLGYHRKRPHVLNGRSDCASLTEPGRSVLRLGCEVISGNSGGPVLVPVGSDWALVAVVAGRIGGAQPQALAVPVDDWLMAQWQEALARAETEVTQ
ncbi:trypsin-like serine protease [uncultured Roseobacter sp.]|uniref:trypsin-like serine peptidase n=1 Tax=uncultured Roseobacter sp. TaxID=114847 RepID=UPI002638E2A0|nr:trypsin-like serine protease [uncultured Roseobacter sp.]